MSDPIKEETIGQRLKRLRTERGLSQRELSAPGVSYAYISRIEAGSRQPSVKALRQLARKLGVSPDYLETGRDIDEREARELRIADAELMLRLDDPARAQEALREALEEALRAGDNEHAARARIALAIAADEAGDHAGAIQAFEEALALDRPSPLERVDVYFTLGRAYGAVGRLQRQIELFERCLEEVTEQAPQDVAAQIRYRVMLSYALADAGDFARAESVVQDALETARSLDDPYMRVRVYWSLARLSEMEGRSAAALRHVRRAIALLEATEDTLHLARAHVLCAWIMTSSGDASGARQQLDRAEQLFGPGATLDDLAMLKVERARAEALLGGGATAVRLAREAIDMLGDQYRAETGTAYWALAEGLALQGEDDAANEAFRRSVDLLADQRRWREAAQAAQAWGKALRRAGREAQALDVLERATELGLHASPSEAAAER
jgi:transcriptional regulator with XRE-family HTH domain